MTGMDEFIFKQTLEECKSLVETTSYLEILNYSVSRRWLCVLGRETLIWVTGTAV